MLLQHCFLFFCPCSVHVNHPSGNFSLFSVYETFFLSNCSEYKFCFKAFCECSYYCLEILYLVMTLAFFVVVLSLDSKICHVCLKFYFVFIFLAEERITLEEL